MHWKAVNRPLHADAIPEASQQPARGVKGDRRVLEPTSYRMPPTFWLLDVATFDVRILHDRRLIDVPVAHGGRVWGGCLR